MFHASNISLLSMLMNSMENSHEDTSSHQLSNPYSNQVLMEHNDKYMCFICCNIMVHPVYASCCNQRMCEFCLLHHINDRTVWECPHCKTECKGGYIRDMSLDIELITQQIKCANDCGWNGYAGMTVHLCGKDKLDCEKCGTSILRSEREDHLSNTCPALFKKCEFCGETMRVNLIAEHVKSCPDGKVKCAKCDMGMKRRDMEAHFGSKDCIFAHNLRIRVFIRELTERYPSMNAIQIGDESDYCSLAIKGGNFTLVLSNTTVMVPKIYQC